MKPILKKHLTNSGMWSGVVGRGKKIRFTDLDGGANVSLLLYNALEKTERYNMPDTLKGQQVFYLTQGVCLHTDMGKIAASITQDTMGWHDTVCGASDAESVAQKYGELTYQDAHNDCHRNGRDSFLVELSKWGLGEESLLPNINFFSKVTTDDSGALSFCEGASPARSSVTIRLEMDCLVVLNTCPHPLNPATEYLHKPVLMEVFQGDPIVPDDDECRNSHPENQRAFQNTENDYALRF